MEENTEIKEETPAEARKRPDETEAEEKKPTGTEETATKKLREKTSPGQTDDAAEGQDESSKVDQTQTDDEETRQMEHTDDGETTSEDLTGVKEEQGEYIDPEELNRHKVAQSNTDDEETTQAGPSAEDDGQMGKERKEESLQAGGEEGGAGSVETDTSVHDHTTNTQDNSSSEEGNETREEDASVDVGEQPKDSGEQRPDEETETQEQRAPEKLREKTSPGQTDDAAEGQDESSKVDQTQTDDEETRQMELTDDVAPAQKPHHGLYNQGATCYLNSVLQVLFMTTEIHERLDPRTHTDLQLGNIFKDLKKRTCGTKKITATFGITNVYEQRDAAECLQKILRLISTKASEVFRGQLRETTTCSEGHIINEEENPFWTLPLSLRDAGDTAYSVQSSFDRIFKEITYTGKNKVLCYDCDRDRDAATRCEMEKAPQILILLLKRFELDRNTRSHFKSHCCVEVPRDLQLKEKTYRLYGRVDHMGSIRGGHYTATVRSEDTWYDCNDSHVKIKQQLFAEDGTFSSRSVYLLMYRASESKVSRKTRQNEKPSKRRLDEETEEPGATKKLREKTSPSQTDDAAERQDETSKVDQMQTDEERSVMEHTDDAAESQEFADTNKPGHTRDMTTDGSCRTASEVEVSVGVEAQDSQDESPDRTRWVCGASVFVIVMVFIVWRCIRRVNI